MAIFDETKRSSSVFFFPGRQNRRFSNSWWIKGWFLVAPNLQLRNHPSFALYREPQEKTWHEHNTVQKSMKKTRISCCEKGEDLIKTFNTIQICLFLSYSSDIWICFSHHLEANNQTLPALVTGTLHLATCWASPTLKNDGIFNSRWFGVVFLGLNLYGFWCVFSLVWDVIFSSDLRHSPQQGLVQIFFMSFYIKKRETPNKLLSNVNNFI